MIGFWIAAVLLSVAAAGLVIAGALRLSAREGAGDPAQQLRRRQLAEIEELIGRGVMAPEEARAIRTEAGRRLLAGDPVGAEAALHKALALDRERPDLWSLLGTARVQAGDGAQVDSGARNAFNEALKRDPTLLGPRYFLARGRIAEGKVSEGL